MRNEEGWNWKYVASEIIPPLTKFIFEIGALKIDLEKKVDTFTRLDVSLLYLDVDLFSNSWKDTSGILSRIL